MLDQKDFCTFTKVYLITLSQIGKKYSKTSQMIDENGFFLLEQTGYILLPMCIS